MSFLASLTFPAFALLHKNAVRPVRSSSGAAGVDLFNVEDVCIEPGERALLDTGLVVIIPAGLYGRIAPRSGLAVKSGIDVLAGVIDSDYRGPLKVVLVNHSHNTFKANPGTAIAQIIFERIETLFTIITPEEYLGLPATARGINGFGSTDIISLNDIKRDEEARAISKCVEAGCRLYQRAICPDHDDRAEFQSPLLQSPVRTYSAPVRPHTRRGRPYPITTGRSVKPRIDSPRPKRFVPVRSFFHLPKGLLKDELVEVNPNEDGSISMRNISIGYNTRISEVMSSELPGEVPALIRTARPFYESLMGSSTTPSSPDSRPT